MWSAIAALLIFTLYTSWETVQLNKTIQETNAQAQAEIAKQQELQETFAIAQREAIILTDPRSVKIVLGTESKELPKMKASGTASSASSSLGLNVPAPSGTRTLNCGLFRKPERQADSLAHPAPGAEGKFVLLVASPPATMEATKALAITEEPAGGSSAPTTKPIWVGPIGLAFLTQSPDDGSDDLT